MFVLTILGLALLWVGLPFAAYCLARAFNERCRSLFDHSTLTVSKVVLSGLAAALFCLGSAWSGIASGWGTSASAPLNGIVLLALAAAIMLGLAFQNYRRTNLLFGTAATLLHVSVAPLALNFGLFLIAVAMLVLVLAMIPRRSVYVVREPWWWF